jgi:uncharacterized RDD family membrane protein YckC
MSESDMQNKPGTEEELPTQNSSLTAFIRRLAAFLIDLAVGLPIGFLILVTVGVEVSDNRVWGTLLVAPSFLIKTLRQYQVGQSLGQKILGLAVRSDEELKLSSIVIRNSSAMVLFVIPFMNIVNVLVIILSKDGRGIHDRLAKTSIVSIQSDSSETKKDKFRLSTSGKFGKFLLSIPIIGMFFIADQFIQSYEMSNLVTQIEISEQVMVDFIDRKDEAMSKYWNGVAWTDFSSAESEVAVIAEGSYSDLAVAKAEILDLMVLPWHTRIVNARADYVAHNEAWIESIKFQTIVGDNTMWSSEIDLDISPTFAVFCTTGPKAVPRIDFFGLKQRIEVICED